MWSFMQRRHIVRRIQQAGNSKPSVLEKGNAPTTRDREGSLPSRGTEAGSENHSAMGHEEAFIVRSSGEDDPLDPLNWPLLSRAKNIAILCFLIFVQGWAGAAESMGNSINSQRFHVSPTAENLATAMYLFGVGSGTFFAGPISESVGRNPTYLVSTFCYLWFVLGSALTDSFGGHIVCRLFVGLWSSATLSINGASVSDQFRPVKRAFVFPIVAWANVAAPVIGPIANGWIVSTPGLGWRWTEWVTLIISSTAFLIAFLFLPETYLPLLLDWKAQELRRITGDTRYTSEFSQKSSTAARIRRNITLPAIFFLTEPIIIVLGFYLVLLYILLFTFLSGFDYIFKQTYQLTDGLEGSCFASIAAGVTAFTVSTPALYAWARWQTEYVRGAPIKPEFRLWPAIVTALLLPISLFWLGWTNYPSISIWSGLAACFIFGIVLIAIYISSYEYITDSYLDHAASALASITMLRYFISGGMVMAARPMYNGIGVHWTLTLLGCIAALLAPAPFLFWIYGPKLRKKSSYAMTDNDPT
ncbi:unnamed protein product [Clonostachys rhizophaga]|uniref:Major facilitator superfamily (MFS) profile domain-containing protein n=1 Tax=Clonostachys rhizophaga TaxID=160324 RepID=A0A9N9YNA8_9HYPO|nr:unnamed protein product [Clonostachys rhizophaga]